MLVHHNAYQLEVPEAGVISLVNQATRRQSRDNSSIKQAAEGDSADYLLRESLHVAKAESLLDELAALAHVWLIENNFLYFVPMKTLPIWHETKEEVFLVYPQCQFDPTVRFHHPCAACLALHKTCYSLWDRPDPGNVRSTPDAIGSNETDGRAQGIPRPDMAASNNVVPVECGSASPRCVVEIPGSEEAYFNAMPVAHPDVNPSDFEALSACIDAAIQRRL